MRNLLLFALALAVAVVVGCAQGTSDEPNHADARTGTGGNPDARMSSSFPDAPAGTPDAFVQPPADANLPPDAMGSGTGGGSGTDGAICNGDNDCDTGAGYCCFDLGQPPGFCVPGTEPIPGVCLPN
jgi:hypothetical protein